MIVGFKEHGFVIAAEHMPDTCTNCPFWLTDLEMQRRRHVLPDRRSDPNA